VPLVLGEFGVTSTAALADRAAWTALVRREADRLGLGWIAWDFATDFGAYDLERGGWHEPLRVALLGAAPAEHMAPGSGLDADVGAR
jgi:endoglucanase